MDPRTTSLERFPLPESAEYSYSRNFGEHQGTDILAPLGTPVLAVETGRAWSDIDPKGGRVVYLEQGKEPPALLEVRFRYYYAHLSEWALKIISATREQPLVVMAGDQIGRVGTSGNATGRPPHLHFQIRFGGNPIDPFEPLMDVDLNHRGKDTPGGARRRAPGARGARGGGMSIGLVLALLSLSKGRRGRLL